MKRDQQKKEGSKDQPELGDTWDCSSQWRELRKVLGKDQYSWYETDLCRNPELAHLAPKMETTKYFIRN